MSWYEKYERRKTLDGRYVYIDDKLYETYAKVTDPGTPSSSWFYYYKLNHKFVRLYSNYRYNYRILNIHSAKEEFPEYFI